MKLVKKLGVAVAGTAITLASGLASASSPATLDSAIVLPDISTKLTTVFIAALGLYMLFAAYRLTKRGTGQI